MPDSPALDPAVHTPDNAARQLHAHSRQLLVVVGRSGVGKDAVIQAWLAQCTTALRPHLVRRVITRERHPSEDHEPVSINAIQRLAQGGRLAFQWQAHGLHYGVRWTELEPLLQRGHPVVLNGSRQHLPQLMQQAPQARVVEIVLPDAVRLQRLAGRGRESGTELAARVARSVPEWPADLVIDNSGPLDDAVHTLARWWSAPATPLAA